MTDIEQYDRITMILFQMGCGVSLLDILYKGMNNGIYAADKFAPAVYAAYEYLGGVEQALRQWRKEAFPSQTAFGKNAEAIDLQHKR